MTTVELCSRAQAKKDEGLLKRRMLVTVDPGLADEAPPPATSELAGFAATVRDFVAKNGPPDDLAAALGAVKSLRKMLSIPNRPPIDEVIGEGLVPNFVTMLGHPDDMMQFEAAWCLTNVASGTAAQCANVVQHNAIPPLVGLLGSPAINVSEQAVWALGNIAGDCPKLRDEVLRHGGMQRVLALVESTASTGQMVPLRNATWALSNLVRGKPQPSKEYVAYAVPMLARLLQIEDDELLIDVCWALSYVTDGDNDSIDLVIQAGCVQPLMAKLDKGVKVQTPALRALCNVVTGSNEATQAVIDAGFISKLGSSLRATKMQTRKEACWALSNITAGTAEQVEAVLSSPMMPIVIDRLEKDEFEVKKEAAWVVANVLHGFKQAPTVEAARRVSTLAQHGVIKAMVGMLDANDPVVQKLMLEAMANLLAAGEELGRAGKGDNPFLIAFDEAEGVDKLELLQEHENEDVYRLAVDLLERFFGEEDEEDQNVAPNPTSNGFSFNAQPAQPFGAQPAFAF